MCYINSGDLIIIKYWKSGEVRTSLSLPKLTHFRLEPEAETNQ